MKTKYILLISLLFITFSCNNWLDITPKGETSKEDMFSDTKGYNTALAGVYYILTSKDLYGQSLSFGEIDLLAKYWDIGASTTHNYYHLSLYNYENINSEKLLLNIWSKYYEAVNNNNIILEEIQKKNSSINTPELIEGEALGLRAMIHMDLYRLFGPVVKTKEDLQKKSIPYRNIYDNIKKNPETCEALLNYVRNDLLKALELFKDDPIRITGSSHDGNTSDINYNNVLDRRVTRMNYYAVVGLLSRVELLLLNPDEAYKYAKSLIDEVESNKLVTFVDIQVLETPGSAVRDFAFSSEHFFALHVNNLYETTKSIFGNEGGSLNSRTSYSINKARYNNIVKDIYTRQPEGQSTDARLRFWFAPNDRVTLYELVKLRTAPAILGYPKAYQPEVPVLKLAELYFIACEAQIGKDNNLALSYLNKVRVGRGISQLLSPTGYTNEELFDFLIREARKEYLACGQMFFLYKRLFAPIYVQAGVIIPPTNEMFELPIPIKEVEF